MNKRPKILYLQHHVRDTGPLLEILEELAPTYQYLAVQTLEEYVNLLQDFRPDIILADEDLDIVSPREALGILQAQEADVPFIVICSVDREDEALELLKAGAVDYVLKEKPQRLFYVLYNQAIRLRAISNMEQAVREKERLYKRNLADTTALKISEKQILKSKANLRALFDHTETAYLLVNDDLRVVSYNRPAEKLREKFGQSEIVIGGDVMDYFPAVRKSEINHIIQRVLSGENVSYHSTFTDADGEDFWYSIKWVTVSNDDEQNWGLILSIRDITASKTTAMALAQANAELSKRNKSLEQFTYIISHNLLAPVANIMGITELLTDPEEKQQHELINGLRTSIKTMDTILKDLSQTLQVKDQVNKKKEEVFFRQLVEEITFSINNLMIAEQVTIHCDFEALQSFYTVRGYLYSIFYNITLNSIKYRRPEASPVIIIKSSIVKDQLLLTFEDNGKGIDMQKNGAHLFSLYKRFDTTTDGKGMGMFMVKTQIEELGGNIYVESQVGVGTKIMISLPVVKG
jgi:PAS domain S-box-containing protein